MPAIKTRDRLRFEAKYTKLGKNDCWLWEASCATNGYGVFYLNGRHHGAHQVAYLIHHGHFSVNFTLHKCDNPACVNPYHLFDGTQTDNMQDALRKKRHKTVFVRGHKLGFQPGNTDGFRPGHRPVNALLTKRQVTQIRKLLKTSNLSQHRIGQRFGVSQAVISRINLGAVYASS